MPGNEKLAKGLCLSAKKPFPAVDEFFFSWTFDFTLFYFFRFSQGWCREEVECQAASFSFVANALGQQETVCLLQNGTQANNPTSKPIPARNQYYMVKMSIRSGRIKILI